MRFFALLASAATLASATNTVKFINQDSTSRTIIFTPSTGHATMSSITVGGLGAKTVTFANGWIGNWYSVSSGAVDKPGMLGEVTFQGSNGDTYFDVSAIVNPSDVNGVKKLFPASQLDAVPRTLESGCDVFPCDNAYYNWDDVQTVVTSETALVCTLGTSAVSVKRSEDSLLPRKFVLGGM